MKIQANWVQSDSVLTVLSLYPTFLRTRRVGRSFCAGELPEIAAELELIMLRLGMLMMDGQAVSTGREDQAKVPILGVTMNSNSGSPGTAPRPGDGLSAIATRSLRYRPVRRRVVHSDES